MRVSLRGLLIAACVLTGGLSAQADNTLRIVDTEVAPGATGTLIPIVGTTDVAIQGMSLALTYPNGVITLTGLDFTGTAIESVLGGAPEYVGVLNTPDATPTEGELIAGIIFDLDPTADASLPPQAAENALVNLVFDVDPLDIPSTQTIEFVDGLGSPPVDNHFSSDGFTILPTMLTSGILTVTNNYAMTLSDPTVPVGGSADVILRGSFPMDLNGFEATVIYRPSELTVNQPAMDSGWYTGLESLSGLSPTGTSIEFFFVTYITDPLVLGQSDLEMISVAASFDFGPPFDGQVLPAGTDRTLLRFPVTVDPSLILDDCVNLELANVELTTGETYDNFLIVDGGMNSIFGVLSGGEICVGTSPGFRRGDANNDGIANIADAVFVITYIFAGGAEPTCFDAADLNDDGINNVADAIYGIQYFFTGGSPPPAPGPLTCGDDPTMDSISCQFYGGSCP